MAKATSSDSFFGATPAPGLRIGRARYLLKRLVGRGDFSELWLGRDIKDEKDVALKLLPRFFLQDANRLELLQEEIRRNSLLKHPHIVPVHDLALDRDSAAIVTDFVDGWSLATLKVDKLTHSYTVEEIEPWIREVCDALAQAHSEFGMVHGDLKPSNLLTDPRSGIQITDFGFAALIRNECSKHNIVQGGYGGIGFLSPQQIMGTPPSRLDDIYSLGATIFDLITGTPPFYKGEVVAQVCGLRPPVMAERLKELAVQCDPIPPAWEETIAACLAKNPGDRPQSVQEVLRLLERSETQWTPARTQAAAEPVEPSHEEEAAETTVPNMPMAQAAPAARPAKLPAAMFSAVAAALTIAALVAALWFVRAGKLPGLGYFDLAPGQLDQSFSAGTGTDNSIKCLSLLPDGVIIAGGYFTHYNGMAAPGLARLDSNGKFDAGFSAKLSGPVLALAIQKDGKIIVGGDVLQGGKRGQRRLLRLNADGSVDEPYSGKSSYNRYVQTLAIQPDGRVLVGGSFTKVLNRRQNGLVRLNPDGSPDTSFAIGPGASATVWSVVVQPDGKILAAGEFRKFNGRAADHLVRLDPDGSFDAGFHAGADGIVFCALPQKDGKILICGKFNNVDGSPYPHIARLNPDGSLDAGFRPEGEMANELVCLAVQPNGKILVGGRNIINRQAHPFLARLNADGARDPDFRTSEKSNGSVWQVAIEPDGKILAAGYFEDFDDTACGNIVRLQD